VITEKDMEGFFKAYPSRCRHREEAEGNHDNAPSHVP
jgi:hypothetical protein